MQSYPATLFNYLLVLGVCLFLLYLDDPSSTLTLPGANGRGASSEKNGDELYWVVFHSAVFGRHPETY